MTRRKPNEYNWDKAQFDETLLTKHFTSKPSKQVRFIVAHHMIVLNTDAEDDEALDACYRIWQSRPASAHYGVDGAFVRQYVWDKDYAWATGNTIGNLHGISIEHANMTLDEPGSKRDYLVDEETWKNGAKLAAYLHKVHKLGRPVKNVTLRRHSDFSATACPGPYFDKIWDQYHAEAVRVYDTIIVGGDPGSPETSDRPKPHKPKPSKTKSKSAPEFPLPNGHWYGVESANPKNHSGYWAKDRDGIRRWQKQMKARGWNGIGAIDGIFGKKSETVCKQFQREKGLRVDGAVGAATWRRSWTSNIT